MGAQSQALALVTAAQVAVVSTAALFPLRGSLGALAHFRDAWELYSVADSNLDVWLLTLLHAVVLWALLSRVTAPRRRFSGLIVPPHYTKVGWRWAGQEGQRGGVLHSVWTGSASRSF